MYEPKTRQEWEKRTPRYAAGQKDNEYLKRKWGFDNLNSNQSLEATRRYFIGYLAHPHGWGKFSISQADYFLEMLEFEAQFKMGEIESWGDFYSKKKEPLKNPHSRADMHSYYEKAKPYINILLSHSKLNPVQQMIKRIGK